LLSFFQHYFHNKDENSYVFQYLEKNTEGYDDWLARKNRKEGKEENASFSNEICWSYLFAIFIVTFAAFNIIATITSPAFAQVINDRRPITETIDITGQTVDTTFCGENGEVIELRGSVRLEYRLVEKGA